MGVSAGLFPVEFHWICHFLYLVILLYAIYSADWPRLFLDDSSQHTLLGGALVLILLWQIRAGLSPGLEIHILGITTLTLMLGWQFAVIGSFFSLLGVTFLGQESLEALSINGLISGVVPALVSYAIMLWERQKFKLFFAYLYVCGFFGAAIAVASGGLVMVALLFMTGAYPWSTLVEEYLMLLPLVMLPEAFINGTFVIGLMFFYPEKLQTLDESRYL